MSDVSPDLIVDAVTGFHRSAALKAGVDLGVFAAIAHGAATADEIAIRAQAAPRGIRSLCDYLAVMGLLEKVHGRYALTKVSRRVPRPSLAGLSGRGHRLPRCPGIDFAVHGRSRRLRAQRWLAGIHRLGGQPGLGDLPRAMTGFVAATAAAVAAIVSEWDVPPRRVLDTSPATACSAFASPSACRVPRSPRSIRQTSLRRPAERGKGGRDSRYQTLPGSAFDLAWGGGYDLILLPNPAPFRYTYEYWVVAQGAREPWAGWTCDRDRVRART